MAIPADPFRVNGRRHRENPVAWGGLVMLALGIILLLDRLGVVHAADMLRFWPMVFVAGGMAILVQAGSLVGRTLGGVMLALGVILQADLLGYLHIRGDVFWPLILIGIGVVMLGRAIEDRNRPPGSPRQRFRIPEYATRWWAGTAEEASVFSHIERRVTDQDFEGLKIAAVFGGFELDLRQAGIKGDEARIEAAAVFGGIEIIVPEEWQVIPRGAGVFGGFTDDTHPPNPAAGTPKRLIVKGAAVFGGVMISNEPPGRWRRHRRWRQYQ